MCKGKKFILGTLMFCCMLCAVLFGKPGTQAFAAELSSVRQATNIVAVVDCSSSMQVSDANWKVPESLCMLVDMCPNESVRLSLVVYGTKAEIVFRDMPLSEENHATVKKMIHSAIMRVGYNRGQTDTGAALSLARTILEEQAGQNNMVMLFTDGAIKATNAGRTTEKSRGEVDSFAVFAQNNQIKVNTLGLFSPNSDPDEVQTSEEELAILKSKTGGEYRRIEDTGAIPEFTITLLEQALSLCRIEMNGAAQPAAEAAGWQYSFSITDRYSDNLTLIIPDPQAEVGQIVLSHADGQTLTVEEWPGAERQTYSRYNGRQGYTVVRMKKMDGQLWEGDYTVTVASDTEQLPVMSAFFFYDVNVHIELDSDSVGVLEPVQVDLYLTTGDGYRIDDADFLKSLTVQLDVINLENAGAEVSQSADGTDTAGLFDFFSEEMKLYNDSFRFRFEPQRATNYQLVARVYNDRFTRSLRTDPVAVTDRLQIESSVLTRTPRKNSPVEIGAYLVQQHSHGKVKDAEFYRLSGATALFTNLTTGATETVELEARADGNGLVGTFTPQDAGDYEVVVRTDSRRENVQRTGQTMTFSVEDRPIMLRKSDRLTVDLWNGFLQGFHAGREIALVGDEYFYDPDGESYRLDVSAAESNGSEMVYDNVLYYQADRGETLTLTLTALDYSGNSVSMYVSIRILSAFEVIALTTVCIILALLALALVVYLLCVGHFSRNELKGTLVMEVVLNGQLPELIGVSSSNGVYHRLPLVRYYIPLVNQEGIEDPDDLLKPRLSFIKRAAPRDLQLGRLLRLYAECYRTSGYVDPIYRYLTNAADALTSHQKSCALRGQNSGRRFSLLNLNSRPGRDQAFLLNGKKKKGLEECTIALPTSTSLNDNFQSNTALSVVGLEIHLSRMQDEPASNKKKGGEA